MKKLAFTVACALALSLVPPSHKSRADGPPKGASAEEIFKWADKNGDGKVTPDELPNKETFAKFDTNGDGVITWEEAKPILEAMIAEKKRLDGGKADGPLRKRLADLVQKFIDRRTWPSAPQSGGAVITAPAAQGPKKIKPGDVGVGRQVADFAFTTLDGKPHRLSDWKSKAGVAIAFTSTTCPVSKRYAPSLARLEKELASRNIALLLVNPFASEKPEDIAAQIKECGLNAPYAHDANKTVAQALHARTTTEVFLVDAQRTLIYRGALDDQYGVNYNLDAPHERYLIDAANSLLAGARPPVAATEAPGCELDIPVATAANTQVTYHRDVARILAQNCVQCHHDKGIAPFALDDVASVTDRAKTIRRVIEDRVMPPWSAAPIPDDQPNPWANDHSLSTRDKADLLAWLGSKDRPLGNLADAPAPLKFSNEWGIGKPDLVVQLKQPFSIKAEGFMPYQVALVETTLTEDKWVQAYEIMPTAREVVHHVIVQVHAKGQRIRAGGGDEGADGYWAAYVPGNSGRTYPEGFARKLPAGATISFQIHYTPNGKATEDQLRMGLVFAKEPPRFAMHTAAVANHKLLIPPGDANHTEVHTQTVPFDMPVTALLAHMHVRGKAFKFDVTFPDGKAETLLDIPRYDFNWQLRYEFKEPRILPRGSVVKTTAIFDNSPANKANPDPTKTVKWGQQTYDEMMIGYFEYYTPLPSTKVASAK